MPFFHGTMEFAQGEFGWTESFFTDQPNAGTALDKLQSLGNLRCACLGNRAAVMRCEVSQYGVRGSRTVGGAAGKGFHADAGMPTDPLLVRLQADVPGNSFDLLRDYPLRGLPQSFYVSGLGSATIYNPAMTGPVKAYLAALTNGDWYLKGSDKTLRQFPINGIAFLADEDAGFYGAPLNPQSQKEGSVWAILTTDANADIPTLDSGTGENVTVLVRRIAWSEPKALRESGLNGTHTALVLYPGVILVRCNQPASGEYKGGGTIVKRVDTFVKLTGYTWEGQTNWKTGRRKYRSASNPAQGNYFQMSVQPMRIPDPPGENQLGADNENVIPGNQRLQTDTIHNAQDLVTEVYKGYQLQTDGNYYPIRIRKILGTTDFYLVTMSGTNISSTNADHWLQDVATAFNIRNSYSANVILSILQNCPKGSRLLLAGDSLGGMVAQDVCPYLQGFGYSVITVQTFGSPIIRIFLSGTTITRYSTFTDLVPTLSPISFTLGLLRPLWYRMVPDPNPFFGPIYNHTHYADINALQIWDAVGRPIGYLKNGQDDADLQVGPAIQLLNPLHPDIFDDLSFSRWLASKIANPGN